VRACATLDELGGGAIASVIDAAVVAVPTAAHAAVAEPLLEAGVAVLVEKPLAATSEAAAAIAAVAERTGALLQVGHVERFNPAWRAATPELERPLFIEGHRLAPFAFRSMDIGVVMDLMIHDLDLLLTLVGQEPDEVNAAGVAIVSRNEDICSARIAFPGGCVANLTASRASERVMRRMRIFTGDRYVSIDLGERQAIMLQRSPELAAGDINPELIDPATVKDRRAELLQKLLRVQPIAVPDTEPLRGQLDAFVAALRSGGASPVPGSMAVKVLQLAERVLASLAEHQAKALNPQP
jgi:predicted dehydrogenase